MRIARPCCALVLAAGCWSSSGQAPGPAAAPAAAPASEGRARPGLDRDRDGIPDEPRGRDRDGDGIPDRDDKCPGDPEDFDTFEDDDGCPDPDNDADGIPDVDDLCPGKSEDADGVRDDDGCPEP